jgi:hypothetical protein
MKSLYDISAPAKLNLFLHVVGRRSDGYHLLESVFRLIDWCDTLHFEVRHDGQISREDLNCTLPEQDLIIRAARSLQQFSGTPLGAHIGVTRVGESPSWLRHWILIPACEGSNPSSPAKYVPGRTTVAQPGPNVLNRWDPHAGMRINPLISWFSPAMPIRAGGRNCQHLGISLGAAQVGRFSDGEVTVEINQNVRARDVFVVQSPVRRPTKT